MKELDAKNESRIALNLSTPKCLPLRAFLSKNKLRKATGSRAKIRLRKRLKNCLERYFLAAASSSHWQVLRLTADHCRTKKLAAKIIKIILQHYGELAGCAK